MPDQPSVLKTKLYRPLITGDFVHRTGLIEKLNNNRNLPLTLVSAPAGYGKSFTISQWIQDIGINYAWISIDGDHNITHTFINYLVTGIKQTYPDGLSLVTSHLKGTKLPPIKEVAYDFINELDNIDDEIVIVLDDYHVIKNEEIHGFISTLLEFPPKNVHLVIVTRIDPPLMINYLRAYGRIHELRVNSLRFTKEEIEKLYNENFKIQLKPETIDHLFDKTEGWVIGLRLAYLHAMDADDINLALLEVKGDIRLITNFILEETLSKQSPQTLQFLLSAAILNRFNAEIIEVINKKDEPDIVDGEAFINMLSEANLFLISLDQQKKWFRFHHLFRDLLLNRLKKYQFADEVINDMHLRAANWFDNKGLLEEAFEHYMACHRIADCVKIFEKRGFQLFDLVGINQVAHWLKVLPEETFEQNPGLLLLDAWIAYGCLRIELIPPIIEKVDILLETQKASPVIYAQLDFFKGNIAYMMGETGLSIELLNQALSHSENLPVYLIGNVVLMLDLARHRSGESEGLILEQNEKLKKIKHKEEALTPYFYSGTSFVQLLSGKVSEAVVFIKKMNISAKKHNDQYLFSWSYFLQGLANLQLFKLPEALKGLTFTLNNKYNLDIRAVLDTYAALALVHELQGETAKSKSFHKLMSGYVTHLGDPNSLSILESSKSRIAVIHNEIESAFEWAQEFKDAPTFHEIFFWVENPWITKAKVLLREGSKTSIINAEKLLLEIQELADSANLSFHNIEISMLLAVVNDKLDKIDVSDSQMAKVLSEVGKSKTIRPLIESAHLIGNILERLKINAIEVELINQILGSGKGINGKALQVGDVLKQTSDTEKTKSTPQEPLLSTRENQVLNFVSEGYRNKEIADKLYVSEVTIKKHLYNIFKKLDVNNRINMIQKARDLKIMIKI